MIEWLSGEVPGGLPLLFFILVSSNLALFYLYKYSALFSRFAYVQKIKKVNGAVLSVYIILWILLRPPTPPKCLIFLPFQVNDSVNYGYSEALEQYIACKSIKNYFIHPWNQFYKTADPDSMQFPDYRFHLTQKMDIDAVLTGSLTTTTLELRFLLSGRQLVKQEQRLETDSYGEIAGMVLKILNETLVLENPSSLCEHTLSDRDIDHLAYAKKTVIDGFYQDDRWLTFQGVPDFDIVKADVLLKRGIAYAKQASESSRRGPSTLDLTEQNPFFLAVQNLLKPYQERKNDTAVMNRILGEVYLYEQKYEYAEYFLKRALMQNPYNARVYFLISFLHTSRLSDMGYKSRIALLEKAVFFDPGFAEAVRDLAHEYYQTGTASQDHFATKQAKQLLENYLSFADVDIPAMGLLAKITLQSEEYDKAIALFQRMAQLGADSAEINYNLGICHYGMNDYQKAEEYFNRAIALDDYKDAYLYLGMIYKNKNDFDRALYYFRERIKRKSGDEDTYAREAMLGVRIILDKIAKAEQESLKQVIN
jgi:tetratricopeptide (TPR) repeat protein